MKKFSLMLVAAIALFSCNSKEEGRDFNSTVCEDYVEFMSAHDTVTCEFYEADIDLNAPVTENGEVVAVRWSEVFQEPNVVHTYEYTAGVKDRIETADSGLWVGDHKFNPCDLKLTLKDAIEVINSTDKVAVPATQKVVLRMPLDGKTENPLYIFGTHRTGFVAVDAMTGDVLPIQ